MKSLFAAALALASALTPTGQVAPPPTNADSLIPASSRLAAPNFTLIDVQGKAITLSR